MQTPEPSTLYDRFKTAKDSDVAKSRWNERLDCIEMALVYGPCSYNDLHDSLDIEISEIFGQLLDRQSAYYNDRVRVATEELLRSKHQVKELVVHEKKNKKFLARLKFCDDK